MRVFHDLNEKLILRSISRSVYQGWERFSAKEASDFEEIQLSRNFRTREGRECQKVKLFVNIHSKNVPL